MTKDSLRIPDYLEHILEAIDRINEYTDDITEVAFLTNHFVQDAVIRNFEIIGEASRNIIHCFPYFVEQYKTIPWEAMYAMRNRISHGYFTISFETVWRTIEEDLPPLKEQVEVVYEKIKYREL